MDWKILVSFMCALALALLYAGCGDDDDGDGAGGDTDTSGGDTDTDTDTDADTDTDTDSDADAGTGTDSDDLKVDMAVCDPAAGPFTTDIDNPYWPMPVGKKLVLEEVDEYGTKVRVEITVLDETEVVAGVTTRVLEEREWVDDQLVEVSRNFFVQAADGSVCYFGEDVDDYADGGIIGHGGAWRAAVDSAVPGIIMPADPQVGQWYTQEVAPGIAEDHGEHVAMGEPLSVPAGDFTETLSVREWSPIEPGATSDKIYVKDIGLAFDDDLELISYTK